MTNKPYHRFIFLLGILGFLAIFSYPSVFTDHTYAATDQASAAVPSSPADSPQDSPEVTVSTDNGTTEAESSETSASSESQAESASATEASQESSIDAQQSDSQVTAESESNDQDVPAETDQSDESVANEESPQADDASDQTETITNTGSATVDTSTNTTADGTTNPGSTSQSSTTPGDVSTESTTATTSPTATADQSETSATTATNNDQLTIDGVNNSTDPTIKQSSDNPIIHFLTSITSASAAALIYPFVATRQGSHLLSQIRTLLSPSRYDVDQMWSDLDNQYDPSYTKQYYTEAKNWYDNEVKKQTLTVPFADGTGTASATYIAAPGSTKTIIYGQGWTTEPEWMGYISKIFYDMGYNVLMPYTRGQNSSDGEFLTFGYKDKQDWINWINKIDALNGKNSEVILYGQSLGADDALETAAQKSLPSSVKAVIADCGYSTVPSLLKSLYSGVATSLNNLTSKIGWQLNGSIPLVPYDQFLNAFNGINQLLQGFSLDDVSGISAVQNSTLPTLFIATADDTFIPDTETETMYHLSNSQFKQLWILQGNVGGHASANNAVLDYKKNIEAFLNAVESGKTTDSNQPDLKVDSDQRVAA